MNHTQNWPQTEAKIPKSDEDFPPEPLGSKIAILSVIALIILVAFLPQITFFQELTGINSWTKFFMNCFGISS